MNHEQKGLLGSWAVEVSTPNQGSFPALLTFMADGGLLADQSHNPLQSAGHGNWITNDRGEVAYTFVGRLRSPCVRAIFYWQRVHAWIVNPKNYSARGRLSFQPRSKGPSSRY